MRRRSKLVFLVLLGAGAAALFPLRKPAAARPRLDVYFEDGSLESFDEDSAAGANMLSRAQEVRRAAWTTTS